ncbi:cupin domain-containing protein [uncultured Maricaulis sp.]|uniref:cupin domain-containing protein n=1 Tax=uncultured Maricaulis sp. TaxID=174710 RepID=UPI0030DA78C9|tara:strand:- start:174461 stop:174892 length:432 start_codon:yes stop_codon:yes gene_type:complete
MAGLTATQIVESLGMQRHPEGGWYVETWRDAPGADGRSRGTAIYYLLEAGQRSHWHRVDATEIWHWHAGAALKLGISEDGVSQTAITLGPDIARAQQPQVIIKPQAWQSAKSCGAWTLVGCTVTPGFEFSGFEMAPPGWEPGL